MKTIIFLSALIALAFHVNAQKSNDFGKIALSVVIPDNVEGLDQSQLSKLESKVTQLVVFEGLSAEGYSTNFVIYPKIAIYETNVVEGGMQNITVVSADLSLFIKQTSNNIIFSSVSKTIKGSGATRDAAINNLISKIAPSDNDYKDFIDKGKAKIIAYYESNCNDIMTQSADMAKKNDYAGALSLLMSIPIEVRSCYNLAQQKSVAIYKRYQNQHCQELLVNAKAKMAATDYGAALDLLCEVDPSSQCSAEANTLIKSLETKVLALQKKQYDLALKIYEDDIALEKYRIDAIRDIAISYNKSRSRKKRYQDVY